METIENRTFDEIQVGDSAHLERRLTAQDIKLFAVMSGDVNPAHVDEDYAKSSRFHEVIAHGMWGGALISTVLGTQLPGPGTIYLGQTLRFCHPVGLGDLLTVTVTVKAKDAEKKRLTFDCLCTNQAGKTVISGEADVLAPTEKVCRPRMALPEVHLRERAHLHRLLAAAKQRDPIRTAVVHPVDRQVLLGVVAAAEAGLIVPTLVGPEHKIRAAARQQELDIGSYPLVATEHSHAAAATAVALARAGEADALMKGSLHTDELMRAVLTKDSGLRTERRVSHVFAFDVPTYPRPLFITDAAINIYPTLADKRDIVQNAIDLAHALPWYARLATKLIKLPVELTGLFLPVVAERLDKVTDALRPYLSGANSVRALSPDHPWIRQLATRPIADHVRVYSIIGNDGVSDPPSDGVVPYSSAHLDGADGELVVRSEHDSYQNPQALAYIRERLLEP